MEGRRKLVYTPDEAAEMLGMSRAKLYQLVKDQLIPYRRINGVAGVKFTQADLDKILADAYRPAVA